MKFLNGVIFLKFLFFALHFIFSAAFFPSFKKEAQLTMKSGYYAVHVRLIFLCFLDLNGVDWNCILTRNESSV